MPELSISHRTRSTPFTDRVTAAGVKAYTVYNHMLLPTVFRSLTEDYHHLKSAVQLWDVSCERQVEITGPDAARLAQLMTPRDLSKQRIGQCLYTPTCDIRGHVLNDPVTIKIAEDRYWVSIADSDIILFARGLAAGMGLDVQIVEPDIYPLAVQGPKAEDLMARVFGDTIRETKFFGTQTHWFGGLEHLIARSGYSGQGGFEIYTNGAAACPALWDTLMEAGRDLDVHAGCPNLIERVETGLLSYGNDITARHTLHETGLARFCKTISPDCIAAPRLNQMPEPERQLRYLSLDGAPMKPITRPVPLHCEGQPAGQISTAIWSPDYGTNIAIGMVSAEITSATDKIVTADDRVTTILNGPIVTARSQAA